MHQGTPGTLADKKLQKMSEMSKCDDVFGGPRGRSDAGCCPFVGLFVHSMRSVYVYDSRFIHYVGHKANTIP